MTSSGRPERPLDRNDGPQVAFACDLRLLRESAGLTYRQMAEKAGYSHNSLAQAAGGARFPSLDIVLAFVGACGGSETHWKHRWREAKEAIAYVSQRTEPCASDRWEEPPDDPIDEDTAAGRFVTHLRRLYLMHERPIDTIAQETGRSATDVRRWLDGHAQPTPEELIALLKAFHAPPGGVRIAQRLHDKLHDTMDQPATSRPFRLCLQFRWGERQWAVTLGAEPETAAR
ncbi:helix-turn-helix domain-containing protein [Kitasatospora sp. NPDC058444]|uniref:helix-turn-helix domain-containing protein n=1 Tax=Kitasatospora sp. NPDC058444 TaxID=3346504 RepID=UPI00365526DB